MLTTRFLIHSFSIWIYQYMCARFWIFHWFPDFFSCLLINACTCMSESHHLIMYTLSSYARHLALILPLVGELSDSPSSACPDPRVWNVVGFLLIRLHSCSVVDQRLTIRAARSLNSLVTPRSGGHENVTATYMHRIEISSRIYVKHQYRPESEYGST